MFMYNIYSYSVRKILLNIVWVRRGVIVKRSSGNASQKAHRTLMPRRALFTQQAVFSHLVLWAPSSLTVRSLCQRLHIFYRPQKYAKYTNIQFLSSLIFITIIIINAITSSADIISAERFKRTEQSLLRCGHPFRNLYHTRISYTYRHEFLINAILKYYTTHTIYP